MLKIFRQKRVAKLWDKGQALLAEGAYEKVLEIARQLETERHSGAFDLAGQAHAALGRLSQAIEVLERGVKLAPQAWLNWQLLGNYYSDATRFDDAAAAYESALGCEGVRRDSVRLNQAILAERRGDDRSALELVSLVEESKLAIHKADMRSRLLLALGDAPGAIAVIAATSAPDEPTSVETGCLGRLHATHAKALLALGKPEAEVRAFVLEALDGYSGSAELLRCLRELRNETASAARLYRVVLTFGFDTATQRERGAVGFSRSGQVIADSPEEAILFFRELERDPLLAFDDPPEVEILEERAGPLKGIVHLSPRFYFASRH